jgi:uncharacterized DUF497 family protein
MNTPKPIQFEWDQGNKEKNWEKHQVYYREAEEVIFNKPLIFPDKKHSQVEHRFQALGITNNKRVLSVIFTIRKDKIRVISARDQNRKEKLRYAKK